MIIGLLRATPSCVCNLHLHDRRLHTYRCPRAHTIQRSATLWPTSKRILRRRRLTQVSLSTPACLQMVSIGCLSIAIPKTMLRPLTNINSNSTLMVSCLLLTHLPILTSYTARRTRSEPAHAASELLRPFATDAASPTGACPAHAAALRRNRRSREP